MLAGLHYTVVFAASAASPDAQFDVTGCVTFVSHESNGLLGLEDASGPAIFFLKPTDPERQLSRGMPRQSPTSPSPTRNNC